MAKNNCVLQPKDSCTGTPLAGSCRIALHPWAFPSPQFNLAKLRGQDGAWEGTGQRNKKIPAS